MINLEGFAKRMKLQLNEAMLEAAEPIIQEALATIERKMRERAAAAMISYIEQRTHFYEREDRIVITFDKQENRNG